MNKKILLGVTKGNWGGAQRYVFDIATSLKDQDYDVVVFSGEPGVLIEKCTAAGIRTIILPAMQRDINIVKEIKSFFTLLKLYRQEKPDILHLNSSKMAGLGSLAGRLVGVPKIIFTVHGWAFNENRSAFSKITIKFLSWLSMIFSDKAIFLSEIEKKQMDSMPWIASKGVVIPNAIKEIDFKEREAAREVLRAASRSSQESPNTVWFGTIAELTPNKGLGYAIEAFSQLKSKLPFVYYIIGQGTEERKLQNLIDQKGLADQIKLAGFQANASALLKAFDIFLLPSVKEGLPYVLLEAGMAGLPIIASKVGGVPNILHNDSLGRLVPTKDSSALALMIQSIINSEDKGAELGIFLKKEIAEKYSFSHFIDKTLATYSN